jgi:hypothetical protein
MALKRITVTPTITAGAYTAGDNVGGLLKFKDVAFLNDLEVVITGVTLSDAASQSAATDLIIFSAKPGSSTFTDNAAQAIADAELPEILHVFNLTSYDSFSDNSSAQINDIRVVVPFTEDGIYAALVTRGTPTYAATTDIDVTLTLEYPTE